MIEDQVFTDRLPDYKGYSGVYRKDAVDHQYFGMVASLEATLTFCGRTIRNLEKAFHDTVDDYLQWCEDRKKNPEKPCRCFNKLHRDVYTPEKVWEEMGYEPFKESKMREVSFDEVEKMVSSGTMASLEGVRWSVDADALICYVSDFKIVEKRMEEYKLRMERLDTLVDVLLDRLKDEAKKHEK